MQGQEHSDLSKARDFLRIAESDARLTATHMSLYFALFGHWLRNDCQCPFSITRRAVMTSAKVSVATYHKCMTELHTFGYITYSPSFHPGKGSTVYLRYHDRNQYEKSIKNE